MPKSTSDFGPLLELRDRLEIVSQYLMFLSENKLKKAQEIQRKYADTYPGVLVHFVRDLRAWAASRESAKPDYDRIGGQLRYILGDESGVANRSLFIAAVEHLLSVFNNPLKLSSQQLKEYGNKTSIMTYYILHEVACEYGLRFAESQSTTGRKTKKEADQPSEDRRNDILAAIKNAGYPLTREELRVRMRLKTLGRLGHHLAWMVRAEELCNSGQGYWPTDMPVPK